MFCSVRCLIGAFEMDSLEHSDNLVGKQGVGYFALRKHAYTNI